MANTLYELYTQQGKRLPSVPERRQMYGLGTDYRGTLDQNRALLSRLQGGLFKQGALASQPRARVAGYRTSQPQIRPVPTQIPQKQAQIQRERGSAPWQKSPWAKIIQNVGARYGVDPQLIYATIMTESGGNPKAIRQEPRLKTASYGLGQILETTARGLGFEGTREELFYPEINIDLIGKYHRNTTRRYGKLSPEQYTVVYNTGRLEGKPWPGHLQRFMQYYYGG